VLLRLQRKRTRTGLANYKNSQGFDTNITPNTNKMRRVRNADIPSPDLSQLQAVSVDFKTTIFIPLGADPEKAKQRYQRNTNNKFIGRR